MMAKLNVLTAIVVFSATNIIAFVEVYGKLTMFSPMPSRVESTKPTNGKPEIVIPAIFNYGGVALPIGPICTESIQVALDAFENASVLTKYHVVVQLHDDQCEIDRAVKLAADIFRSIDTKHMVPVLVGPACGGQTHTGLITKFFDFLEVADVGIAAEIFLNRKKYSSFYSVLPSMEAFFLALPSFLAVNGWRKVYLLTETYEFWTAVETYMEYVMMGYNITLAGTAKVITPGGNFPEAEHFLAGVQSFALMDPKIMIIISNFGAIIPCLLYAFGLFGPNRVIFYPGWNYFLPNSFIRTPGCTDEMLGEVLKSVIFFSYGLPIVLEDNPVDVLGVSKKKLEEVLDARIEQPNLSDKYFQWRAHCYDAFTWAALALNDTDAKLRQKNDSLGNWLTNTDAFRSNSTYIQEMIRESLEQLHFKGLHTYERDHMNGRVVVTGFFQMRFNPEKANPVLSAGFSYTPVAVFDPLTTGLTNYPEGYVWRTHDGAPPFDSLRIMHVRERTVSEIANGILLAIAAAFLAGNLALLVMNLAKRNLPVVSKSLPYFNSLILIGNCFMLSFVLILPAEGDLLRGSALCIASSLHLVFGFSLVSGSILGKMHLASVLLSQITTRSSKPRNVTTSRQPSSSVPNPLPRCSSTQPQQQVPAVPPSLSLTTIRLVFGVVLAWAVLQLILMSIWMGLSPPQMARFDRKLEASTRDISLMYQHFTYACHVGLTDNHHISLGFLATLLILYAVVVLRSLYLAYFQRKSSPILSESINDFQFIRIVSYMVTLTVIAGGATVWLFYAGKDPGDLQTAVSALDIIVVLSVTLTIFAPKLRRNYYI